MLRQQFTDSLKQALKDRDQDSVAALRLIIAALKDRDIGARGKGNADGVGDDEILVMLQGMVKQRRDSIALFTQGGRSDLVDKEQVKWVVLMVLFAQPGQETAFSRMEDLVFEESTGAMN